MSERAPFGIRTGREDDAPLIISTWVNSYRYGNPEAKRMVRPLYMQHQRWLVLSILVRPTTLVLVAHDPGYDSVVYGYLVAEKGTADRDVIHYVYVKEPWQHLGICTGLLTASGIDLHHCYYTHTTRDRMDTNPNSPSNGIMRWRGSETLLAKWPAAEEVPDPQDPSRRRKMYQEGNVYVPHLAYVIDRSR